ncbi:MAG: peptidylprolyl isomerase [Firmicutes bacterium]|nr:peptidylprolyl isomerase [Bacillota bacterium]
MATKYVDGALAAEVPEKLEGQVQLVIHSIAAPAEKKNKQILLTAVISGVVCIALIVGIVLGGKAIQNHSYTDTTSGEGGTSTVTPDGLKTTSTLDAEKTYYADITVRDYGKITVKLDQKNAPVSASNFVELAEDGFYDGLTFHRIMEGFMMQGGDPQGDGYGGSKQNILGEFASNGVNNPLSHTRGAISMARSGQPNSGSSQFFIVHEDSTFLDGDYAVFGYVTEGIEVVDAVCKAAEPTDGNGTIPAAKQPIMESVVIRTE